MTATDILRRAREILSDRSHWTHSTFARDRWSKQVPVDSPRAVRFCAIGALNRAAHELGYSPVDTTLDAARKELNKATPGGVVRINDMGRGAYASILAAYDRAIEAKS